MALGKTAIKGGIAALMVAMMTAGAFAWEAYATSPLNVRSGPGTNYSVIASLQRNQVVDVQHCRSGWCFLDTGRYGRTGSGPCRRRSRCSTGRRRGRCACSV